MKKLFASITILPFLILSLSGCLAIGNKSASLTIIYGVTAVLSLLLLLGYFFLVHKKEKWFVLLFSSVLVVNIGYFCLAVSSSLEEALMANRLAYLGSVLLPMSMLMIILKVTNTKYKKWLPFCLICISAFVLFVAASPGYLDIYYKEVSFEVINGVSRLVKVYGSWHNLYLLFLFGYFGVMVATIIHAAKKKTIDTTAHAIILAIAVFVNIGVWFIEQLVSIEFEMLSISYIISELFLLGVHLIMTENQKLKELVKDAETLRNFTPADDTQAVAVNVQPNRSVHIDCDQFEVFISGVNELTPTELSIYEFYIARTTTKEIMAALNIKENTLKFHNKNIYRKLGVSSRKELLEIYKQITAINAKQEETPSNCERTASFK